MDNFRGEVLSDILLRWQYLFSSTTWVAFHVLCLVGALSDSDDAVGPTGLDYFMLSQMFCFFESVGDDMFHLTPNHSHIFIKSFISCFYDMYRVNNKKNIN